MAHDPLNLNPEIDTLLENALSNYNRSLQAVDQLIVDNIKQNIDTTLSHSPFIMFSLFEKYASIASRPNIKVLLVSIISKNQEMLVNFMKKMNKDLDLGCNKLEKIFICRRLYSKAKQIEDVSHTLDENYLFISMYFTKSFIQLSYKYVIHSDM